MKLHTEVEKIMADTETPVSLYLKLRDKYLKPLLLESSDYNSKESHYSYIGLNPIAEIILQDNILTKKINDQSSSENIFINKLNVLHELIDFKKQFAFNSFDYKFSYAGLFGYTGYDAIPHFEDIEFKKNKTLHIPELFYAVYSLILIFDHNNCNLYIASHAVNETQSKEQIEDIKQYIKYGKTQYHSFEAEENVSVNYTEEEFKALITNAKKNCADGDVFQLVLSKRFSQNFKGDEFNVYRTLRNINPSPYLFYFDLGSFKIFGSSPEAQLVVNKNVAEIHPIAGTYKRTGNDHEDELRANELLADEKEQAEHMMLVDLARNDLNKYCKEVKLAFLKQTQFYSHVIHLVSKVKGKLRKGIHPFDILTGTFPAGTLSGAPKHRAMQLIDGYENCSREFYGGCIGFISHDDQLNHAIMIRTFLSKDYTLYYQAGAGVVISSSEESENNEVHHKISVLQKAIEQAKQINNTQKSKHHETATA